MKIERTLAFAEDEYRTRLANVRKSMADRQLDALLLSVPENICYLAGYHTAGYYYVQVLIVPLERDPVLVLRRLEQPSLEAYSWFRPDQGVPYDDSEDPTRVIARVLTELGLARGHLAVEKSGFFFPVDKYEGLVQALPNARLLNGTGVVEQQRAVKSPAEIAYIRQACRISELGMQAVVDHCRAGMTENELAAHIHKAVVEHGGEYPGLPLFVSSGHRTLVPHATWSDKVIRDGDNVLVELTGVVCRYAGPLYRTFVMGTPPPKLVEHAVVVEDMLTAVIETLRPGVTAHEVNAVRGTVTARAGLPSIVTDRVVAKRAGYSVGLNFPPDWGEGYFLDLKQNDPTVLRSGMVFHIPQTLRVPGEMPFSLSETVLLTEAGREVLTQFQPRKLIVL